MVGTVLPPPATSRGSGVVSGVCTSRARIGINPACFAKPAAADAKKPKRPACFRDGDPPAKRVRAVSTQGEPDGAAAATKIKKRPHPGSRSSSPRAAADSVPVIKNVSSVSQNQIPDSALPSKTSPSSMSELIAKARLAKARPDPDAAAEAERLRDIQRRRVEARRELEMMVATVEFNDPFIDPSDVLK